MKTKLISISQPMGEHQGLTPEELITYCARVSNPSNQENHKTAPKLLRFLIKHGHWSPFEMVSVCYEIETSLAIATQILRHRSFSFQQFSMRYSEAQEMEPIELRTQADDNRQSSSEIITDPFVKALANDIAHRSISAYKTLIEQGVAREQARLVLPTGMKTRLYMMGTLRSWLHYLEIRRKENTQKEHRLIAEAITEDLSVHFPVIFKAFEKRGDQ